MGIDIKLFGHYGLTAVIIIVGYFMIDKIEFLGWMMTWIGIILGGIIVLDDRELLLK